MQFIKNAQINNIVKSAEMGSEMGAVMIEKDFKRIYRQQHRKEWWLNIINFIFCKERWLNIFCFIFWIIIFFLMAQIFESIHRIPSRPQDEYYEYPSQY